jgi:hypothetical protein
VETIVARFELIPRDAVQRCFMDYVTEFYELHSEDYEEEQRFLQEGWREEPGDDASYEVDDSWRELVRRLARQEAKEQARQEAEKQEEELRTETRRQFWSPERGRTGGSFWVLGREPLHDHYGDESAPDDDYEGDDLH